MKATVSQQQLAHGLSIVSRAVSPRSTLPVLANVLVATDEGRLRLSATNLELGITCWIGAQIEEEGSTTVPARTFTDLVSTLPNDQVSLHLEYPHPDPERALRGLEHRYQGHRRPGIPAHCPRPILPMGIQLNVADFKEMIQQVVFAASTDEARPVLMGVLVTVAGNKITLAAADGFRMFGAQGRCSPARSASRSPPSSRPGR